jgi:hypothetical protein
MKRRARRAETQMKAAVAAAVEAPLAEALS